MVSSTSDLLELSGVGRRRRSGGERRSGSEGVAGVSEAVVTKGERTMARCCEWGWAEVWC